MEKVPHRGFEIGSTSSLQVGFDWVCISYLVLRIVYRAGGFGQEKIRDGMRFRGIRIVSLGGLGKKKIGFDWL